MELLNKAGFRPINLDATVILQKPKLKEHIPAIRERLAAETGLAPEYISVKAKTNEGVDATGRGEAVAVHAAVLIEEL